MALSRTKSRLTIPAPPPSPIPTGTGSRSAANETFKQFLEKSIHLPQLSLPESRFISTTNPSLAVIDFRSLASPSGGDATARMLRSANEFGAFRIVNHGISGEEILSVVNEAKSVWEDDDQSWAGDVGNREVVFQVRRRNDSEASENTVVQAATNRQISEKMEKLRSKLEGIEEKISERLWKCMGENMKKGDKKESIFSVYRYNNNHQNPNPCERENKTKNMMSLHIPGEHCQFSINSYQQPSSFTFDAAADTIVVTLGEQLVERSLGKLKSARSEMTFVPDLLGSRTSFSIELEVSNRNLVKKHSHSKIITIYDQILVAFYVISVYVLYNCMCSLFKGK
ncbi:uncharacterized protein LOC111804157 [Cucurbita pepo subsp. pepo]|uniref:uncharacterized protein LOC111804157 n=1 Tax=Cucurbita pepo subsp. pepo TaxID=3664 RepID=UPI000C9D67D3|nr:uncharacterized protein LOC111804157 [Cucurbita pepo subsp. pepo]